MHKLCFDGFCLFFVEIHFRGNISDQLACLLVVDIIVKINNLLLLNEGGLRVSRSQRSELKHAEGKLYVCVCVCVHVCLC